MTYEQAPNYEQCLAQLRSINADLASGKVKADQVANVAQRAEALLEEARVALLATNDALDRLQDVLDNGG